MSVQRSCDRCDQRIVKTEYDTERAQVIWGWNKRLRKDLCGTCTQALTLWWGRRPDGER